jgi:two-component system sensor histidine kinase DegS
VPNSLDETQRAFAAFRDVERQLRVSGESLYAADSDDVVPSEQVSSLRGEYLSNSDALVGLANTARRVETVMRQLELSALYLRTPVEVPAIADSLNNTNPLHALELQEEERQRLAREIHDGPAQILANAIFQIEFCLRLVEKDPPRLPAELARLKDDLREGLADIRYFIFDLRSDQLAEVGLVPTLRRYVESYQSRFGIEVVLTAPDDLPRLDGKRELAVFRIVQEALQNTRKHSGATSASVELRVDGGVLDAEIADTGQGFSTDTISDGTNRHFGLVSMRERAELIDGTLEISSVLGEGTRVTVRVPLQP